MIIVERNRRWIPWLIALCSAAFGAWVLHDARENRLVAAVDRTFQDWLTEENLLPRHAPVPVALVEMEDAASWTALEYSLFLKALPRENSPIVILENLPPEGQSAYDRAFRDLAIQQPGLILPVTLSRSGEAEKNPWWLDGLKMDQPDLAVPAYISVESGPPEALRGTTAVGVANLARVPSGPPRAPAYVALGTTYLPSLALRATMLAWKITPSQIVLGAGLILDRRHLPVEKDGTFPVDLTFLPGVRRVASSDLLLRLEPNPATTPIEPLEGVVILGNLSEAQRVYPVSGARKLTRAEVLAAAVATLCNGPVAFPPARTTLIVLLLAAALTPLLFQKADHRLKGLAFCALIAGYILFCIFLAGRTAVLLPVFMPVAVFILCFGLNHFATSLERNHARPANPAD